MLLAEQYELSTLQVSHLFIYYVLVASKMPDVVFLLKWARNFRRFESIVGKIRCIIKGISEKNEKTDSNDFYYTVFVVCCCEICFDLICCFNLKNEGIFIKGML